MELDPSNAGVKAWLNRNNLKTFGIVNLGTFLLAVGVYFFKFPNHFTTGGVSGISILFGKQLTAF